LSSLPCHGFTINFFLLLVLKHFLVQLNHLAIHIFGKKFLISGSLLHVHALSAELIQHIQLFVSLKTDIALALLFIFVVLETSQDGPLVHLWVESDVLVYVAGSCPPRNLRL
jgi:hypothetical protein